MFVSSKNLIYTLMIMAAVIFILILVIVFIRTSRRHRIKKGIAEKMIDDARFINDPRAKKRLIKIIIISISKSVRSKKDYFETGSKIFDLALKSIYKIDVGYIIEIASRFFKKSGNYDIAIDTLELSIEFFPSNPEALISLADIYLELGSSAKAKEFYEKAINYDPLSNHAYNMLGQIKSEEGFTDEAIDLFKKAIACKNSDFNSMIMLSNEYTKVYDTGKAMHYFMLALANGYEKA